MNNFICCNYNGFLMSVADKTRTHSGESSDINFPEVPTACSNSNYEYSCTNADKNDQYIQYLKYDEIQNTFIAKINRAPYRIRTDKQIVQEPTYHSIRTDRQCTTHQLTVIYQRYIKLRRCKYYVDRRSQQRKRQQSRVCEHKQSLEIRFPFIPHS